MSLAMLAVFVFATSVAIIDYNVCLNVNGGKNYDFHGIGRRILLKFFLKRGVELLDWGHIKTGY